MLAGIGVVYVRKPAENLETILRFAGWFIALASVTAMVSGILAAPDWVRIGGPEELDHHRYMGIMVGVCALVCAIAFEFGVRQSSDYLKRFSALTWFAVFFGAVGTGHWGGSVVHSDRVPWDGTAPLIEEVRGDE